METWLSGRKYLTANEASPLNGSVGSNPTVSVRIKMSVPKGAIFIERKRRSALRHFCVGFEALLPYLRMIPIVSKWERGTAPVGREIPGSIQVYGRVTFRNFISRCGAKKAHLSVL